MGYAARQYVSRAKAFTLLELLLVVAIITVLLAGSLPRFSGAHERTRLEETAKTALAAARYAHEQAIARRRPIRFGYDLSRHRWQIEQAEDIVGSRFAPIEIGWDSLTWLPRSVRVARLTATSDGIEQAGDVLFGPYRNSPAVDLVLTNPAGAVLARYVGATRFGDIRWIEINADPLAP